VTTFNNNLIRASSWVGLHPQLVTYDVTRADGTNVGINRSSSCPPALEALRWYAGDIRKSARNNTRDGQLVVTPIEFAAPTWSPPKDQAGPEVAGGRAGHRALGLAWTEDAKRRAAASVGPDRNRDGRPDKTTFRDFALVHQKQMSHRYADGTAVENVAAEGSSPRTARTGADGPQLWHRADVVPLRSAAERPFGNVPGGYGAVPNAFEAYSNSLVGGDPVTPVFTVKAGRQTRLRLLEPHGSFRGTIFKLHGHCGSGTRMCVRARRTWGSRASAPPPRFLASAGFNPVGFYLGGQESVQPATHFEVLLRAPVARTRCPGTTLPGLREPGQPLRRVGLLRVE